MARSEDGEQFVFPRVNTRPQTPHLALGNFPLENIYYLADRQKVSEVPTGFVYYFRAPIHGVPQRVRYKSDAIYVVLGKEEGPYIELEQGKNPLLQLPHNFAIRFHLRDLGQPWVEGKPSMDHPNPQRTAWWTPEIPPTPTIIKPSDQLLNRLTWQDDQGYDLGYSASVTVDSMSYLTKEKATGKIYSEEAWVPLNVVRQIYG